MVIINIKQTETGFTIIEVMIAILIFSLGILSAASMQTASIFGNSNSMKFTEASQFATNQAEEINMIAYNELEDTYEKESEGSNGEVYTITSKVLIADNYKDSNDVEILEAREVSITVEWDDKSTDLTFIKTPAF